MCSDQCQPIRKARVERFLQLMFDPAIKAAMLQEVQHDIAAMVRSMAVLSAAVSMALRSVSDEQQ
jgi:hypothetical protein